jgi:hypothetical protein
MSLVALKLGRLQQFLSLTGTGSTSEMSETDCNSRVIASMALTVRKTIGVKRSW